jgi:ABC-2 type transport system ATP-binding protein
MDFAITAEGLRKKYATHEALCGVDLEVPTGSVLGVLGPNGAGKTTTVRILSTLVDADGGVATVAGYDVAKNPREVRARIGLTGQYAAVDERLTGRENLILIGTLYHLGRREARARAAELLDRLELVDAADRLSRTYSGGMRRRLDLAASLVADPAVLFLDEPTTGLDPASRTVLWRMIRDQVDQGVSVLLTTQYLEEADQLADRIVVIDAGKVVAEGSPDELKRKVGGERVQVKLANTADLSDVVAALGRATAQAPVVDEDGATVSVSVDCGILGVSTVACALNDVHAEITDFAVRRPSLDDVFFSLIGHGAQGPVPAERKAA